MDGLQMELDALKRILSGQEKPDSLDFRLLRQLTGKFSDDQMIGEGGCGQVYKGILPDGVVIAVKKLKKEHVIDDKMFLREVDCMIKVGHQNIVRFLGYCSEIKEKAVLMDDGGIVMAEEREKLLCFEYIRKGSLHNYITDELRGFEWHTRYQIIKGICDGLLHLHKEKGILHMDLKPLNILMDDQMVPKITDFGISRIDGKTQMTTQCQFSLGYSAPEYIHNGKRSWKSDIYSLGVIMIELVTGRKEMPNTTKVLRRWRHRWNKSSKHIPLWYQQVKKCLELAVSCKEENPIDRPFIWDLVRELKKLDSWDGQTREPSLEKIISSSDDMLGIEPLELYFPLAHEKEASCSIELTNDTDHYMTFRIATTSPLPFSIQPCKGIAAPRSKCRTSIALSAQEMTPLRIHNHCKGEFVVQSNRTGGTLDMLNEEGRNNSWEKVNVVDEEVDEVNLTILFDMVHEEHQKDPANLSAQMGSLGTSSQETQQFMELSPHHDYEDSRNMEVLERILDGRQSPSHLPFSLLQYITAGFSNEREIGRGGTGVVYKGILGNKIVAVKKFAHSHTIEDRMFHRKIATTMTVEHKNIVRFLGYCSYTEDKIIEIGGKIIAAELRERLLCFEYISNGDLGKYLTDELRGLAWHTRYQIILGICEGLQHLHKEQLVHLNVKPSNIILSDDMVPKIIDFGLYVKPSNIILSDDMVPKIIDFGLSRTMSSDGFRSLGYFAPEYRLEGRMSAKSDIYALGVVIEELVTGSRKRANINNVLRRWRHRWSKSKKYTPLWPQQVTKCLELALRCTHTNPIERPHIWDIIHELKESTRLQVLDDMLGIEPLEIHFPFELSRQHSRSIQLTNETDHYIAFFITTTESPISTQPNKGVVPPRSLSSVTITLQAQEDQKRASYFRRRGQGLLVLSTRVDGGFTAEDIDQDMFSEGEDKVVDKVSVTVIFDEQ